MSLISQKVKSEPGYYWVGLYDVTKVFLPANVSIDNESEYIRFLKIKAESNEEAEGIVLNSILEGSFTIVVDRLWVWRYG